MLVCVCVHGVANTQNTSDIPILHEDVGELNQHKSDPSHMFHVLPLLYQG